MARPNQFYPLFKISLILLLFLHLSQAQAGILISTSRVIFKAEQQEQLITLANTNQYPVLAQLWVDTGLGKLETVDISILDIPFLTVPVIFRLEPSQVTSARIISNGQNLSKNQEQLFWINIYELPAINQTLMNSDHLQMAIHTQLKLIHRPAQLADPDWNAVFKTLRFTPIQHDEYLTISIDNQSPYIVNLLDLHLAIENEQIELANEDDNTLLPFASKQYRAINKAANPLNSPLTRYEIGLTIIDDHGSSSSYKTEVHRPEPL